MRSEIAAAFEESARVAPDTDEVMAGIRAGIVRRRIRVARTRIVVAVMIVVVVLGATVASLSVRKENAPAEPDQLIRIGEWSSTVELPYVPQGMTLRRHDRTDVAETIEWADEAGRNTLRVRVDNVDRERNVDRAGWAATTINYLPARMHLEPGLAVLVRQLASGRWVEVTLRLEGLSQSDMGDQLQMYGWIDEKLGLRLSVDFGLTYLPAGHRIIGVGIEPPLGHGFGTITTSSGSLAPRELEEYPVAADLTDQRRRPDLGRGLTIAIHQEYPGPPKEFRRLGDIGGRPAFYYFGNADHELVVRDFHGGVLVITNVSTLPADSDSLAELIKVAEGVRWLR